MPGIVKHYILRSREGRWSGTQQITVILDHYIGTLRLEGDFRLGERAELVLQANRLRGRKRMLAYWEILKRCRRFPLSNIRLTEYRFHRGTPIREYVTEMVRVKGRVLQRGRNHV